MICWRLPDIISAMLIRMFLIVMISKSMTAAVASISARDALFSEEIKEISGRAKYLYHTSSFCVYIYKC